MEEIAEMFFEFSNVERLEILNALLAEEIKLTDISRRFNLTTSETSRHLTRLLKKELVKKTPDGLYTTSNFGKILMTSLPFFEFVNKNKEYINTHDFSVIPSEFLARLGEIRDGRVIDGPYQVIDVQNKTVQNAQERIWIMAPEPFESMIPLLDSKQAEGVDVRIIIPSKKMLLKNIVNNGSSKESLML